jgi:DNA polymerase I
MRREHASIAKQILALSLSATKAKTIHGLYEAIAPGTDRRIRTSQSPVGTETGRFNSSSTFLEPSTNLQVLPKKTAMLNPLYEVRQCIVASPGHTLIELDLSQAEARVVAAYCGDDELLEVFTGGRDVHAWTAARIFNKDEASITGEERELGKFGRHSLNYKGSWMTLMRRINKDSDLTGIAVSASRSKAIVEGYYRATPKLLEWWDALWEEVQQTRYLINAYGRRRDFVSPYLREEDCIAYLPQSTIADHTNEALCRLHDAGFRAVLQVHDSVMLEQPTKTAVADAAAARELMTFNVSVNGYDLELPVDVKLGERWSELRPA